MKIVFVSHFAHSQGGAQGVLVDLIKGIKQYYPEYQIYNLSTVHCKHKHKEYQRNHNHTYHADPDSFFILPV